jgi:predicted transcriptional regulator of viral defense system
MYVVILFLIAMRNIGFKTRKNRFLKVLGRLKVMPSREARKFGLSLATLSRMNDSGEIVNLGKGLYSHPSMDPFAGTVAASKIYRGAIISHITALVVHGLSDERVDKIDIDIDRTTSIRHNLFSVHRVAKRKRIGVTHLSFHGVKIKIYDRERTLCEAYRIDPAGAIFFKALKRYLKMPSPNIEKIAKYDKVLRTQVLKHLRQEWADA